MKYRKLGRTGLEVSEISMGLEHLLVKEESVVVETVRAAIEGGVNYFDCFSQTDFPKNPATNDEYIRLGKALEGLRDKVYLAYLANAFNPVEKVQVGFECFLREVKIDYTDVFLISCCDKPALYDTVTGSGSLLEYARKLRDEGKVRYIGFGTHSADMAFKAIDSGDFDVLLYPVNPAFDVVTDEEEYMSEDFGKLWDAAHDFTGIGKTGALPRKSVYSQCEQKGVGLVAMKPFAGGWIFRTEKEAGFTPLNLISYALSQSGVSAVVPGCKTPQEIEEILTYYTCPPEELDYSGAVAKSRWSVKENCLYCTHCLPCQADIDIAGINKLLDNLDDSISSDTSAAFDKYRALTAKASSCIECGDCMERCPFQVEIIKKMKRAAKIFET